jgi:uncharacterized protein YciI
MTTLNRSYSTDWSSERWVDAVGEALCDATEAAQSMVVAKAAFLEAAKTWADAEEWVATITAAQARFTGEQTRAS